MSLPVIEKALDVRTGDTVTVWGLFDVHLDSVACEYNRLQRDIASILADPLARVVIGGDFNDMIWGTDPRYQPSRLHPDLSSEDAKADSVVDMNEQVLAPLADRIDVYLCGNHEHNYALRHGTDVAARTAKRLGVPYVGYDCWLRYSLGYSSGQVQAIGCLYHGAGGDSPVTGGMIGITRNVESFDFDFAMSGHIHKKTFAEGVRLCCRGDIGRGRTMERQWAHAICGTYERTYPPGVGSFWGARGRHKPAPLGAGRVYLDCLTDDHGRFIRCRIN